MGRGYPESVSKPQQAVWVHQIGVVAVSYQRARIIARGSGVSLNSETTQYLEIWLDAGLAPVARD